MIGEACSSLPVPNTPIYTTPPPLLQMILQTTIPPEQPRPKGTPPEQRTLWDFDWLLPPPWAHHQDQIGICTGTAIWLGWEWCEWKGRPQVACSGCLRPPG